MKKRRGSKTSLTFILAVVLFPLLWGSGAAWADSQTRSHMRTLASQSSSGIETEFDDKFGTISWLHGSFAADLPHDPVESSYRFMEAHSDVFRISSPRGEFRHVHQREDGDLGTRHVYFDQYLNGVPVWGHRLGFHYDRSGNIYVANGRYNPSVLALSASPLIRATDAVASAKAALMNLPDKWFAGASEQERTGQFVDEPVIWDDYIEPSSQLVYYPDPGGDLMLAYLVRFSITYPPGDWLFFVDALDGSILLRYNNIQSAGPATGTGIDLFGNTVPLNIYQDVDGKYKLIDASKYMYSHTPSTHPYSSFKGVIEVRDAGHALDAQNNPVAAPNNAPVFDPNGDRCFDDAGNADPKSNYRAAVSLAKHFSDTYDFLNNVLGRNSVDGQGLSLIGNVHHGINYANGFWRPDYKMIYFGDSDGTWPYTRGKDWVAHETAHGLTQYQVPPNGFTYMNQSGALNEAYSDMLAMAVDYDNWDFGGAVGNLVPGRYINNPAAGNPPQPGDMYNYMMSILEYDQGGVHFNNGIATYAFYLMSTNAAMPVTPPAADGRITAYKIAYRAYTYLAAYPNASLRDWGVTMKQAAIDLYGPGAVYNAVVSALNTVHIPQAKIVSFDAGYISDQNGNWDTLQMGPTKMPICGSVVIDPPTIGAKLMAVGVGFAGFFSTTQGDTVNPNATYDIFLCPLAGDNTPDEPNCSYLNSYLASSAKQGTGEFTMHPVPALTANGQFHAVVCYDYDSYSFAALLLDNGSSPNGHSFVKALNVSYSYYWSNYHSSIGNRNIMIRAIFDDTPATPPAPTLSSPVNAAVLATALQATLSWNAASGATTYFLEVNTSNSWGEATRVFYGQVNATSQVVTGLLDNGTVYYWRVWSGNYYNWSAPSATRSFSIGCSNTNTVRVVGLGDNTSLSAAYARSFTSAEFDLRNVTHAAFNFNSATKTVTLKGGYNCDFSQLAGAVTVSGAFTISQGTIYADQLIIR